jgi:hypothetical protein
VQAVRTLPLVVNASPREDSPRAVVPEIAEHSSWIAESFAWNAQVPMDYLEIKALRGGFVALDIIPSGDRLR